MFVFESTDDQGRRSDKRDERAADDVVIDTSVINDGILIRCSRFIAVNDLDTNGRAAVGFADIDGGTRG